MAWHTHSKWSSCPSASFLGRRLMISGTILVIPLAVAYYFLARHFADSHQLLIWHRAEIESSGKLVG